MNGTVEALTPDWRGATLVTAVGSVLTVDDVADFDEEGGWLTIADGAPIAYITVDDDAGTVTLAGTAGTVEAGDPVVEWDPTVQPAGAKVVEYLASVMTDRGPVDAVIEHEKIPLAGVDTLVGASVSLTEDDYGTPYVDQVLGREPAMDGQYIVAGTLPPPELTDLLPPDNATTVTPIGGIGSMFYRWTEITNNDPVTYRLHVRDGSAPTTDGTYEVAAGVGLTSASVRKLKDGTAIVGDGTVTYHAIVTVEDADGPGPASTDVTGIPAQVNTADIAVNAVTADHIQFNTLSGETITGLTIQTASTGKRTRFDSDDFTFYSGDPAETLPAAFALQKLGSEFRFYLLGTTAGGAGPTVHLITSVVGGVGTSSIILDADSVDIGTIDGGDVGTGTFRDSLDARIATQSTDSTEVTALVNSVAPTVTMTTGGVGTGAFRDSVDARANAMSAARMQAGTASSGTVVAATTKTVTVTFPTAFSSAPKVAVTGLSSDPGVDRRVAVVPGSETTTTFQIAFWRATGTASFDANWLAVKP